MSRILIIEDEEAIADLEKDYLELSDFEVEIEHTGNEGLEKALKESFDLVVLDLMLPGMDGFEVCKKIREEKNIPILMVSAKKDDIDKIRGLGLGADDYMTKPFSPRILLAKADALLRRSGCAPLKTVNAGSITGSAGAGTKRFVRRLLKQRQVHFIATDAHDMKKRLPNLSNCADFVSKKYGEDYCRELFYDNPLYVIRNEEIALY